MKYHRLLFLLTTFAVSFFSLESFGELRGIRQIAAGAHHTCALDSEGVKCWGDNEFGQTTVPNPFSLWNVQTSLGPILKSLIPGER